MRLFTGIDVPSEVKSSLSDLLVRLKPHARLRWQPPGNLHITTKFIGEWPEERLPELVRALRGLRKRPPFGIAIRGLGWFPNDRAPRIFWTGIEGGPALADLARETDEVLEPLGIARENRPFSPHLTLARLRDAVPLESLLREIAAVTQREFGNFTADRFRLYLSELKPQGSVYTPLEEFAFQK